MSKLRLLIIDGQHIPDALNHVPNDLRYLLWSFCSLKCLPSSFQPKKLVQLDLRCSKFEYLWEEVMHSVKLKFIDLSCSRNLIRTPDFSGVPRLEGLKLSWCNSLVEIHPSIGQLSRLSNMDDLKSLEKLSLCGCSKLKWLKKFPSTVRYINARFCFSLNSSPALVKLSSSSQPCSQSCLYDESSSELAFTILYHYLQGLLCCKTDYETCTKRKEDVTITEFQIIVRGFEITSWLTHQCVGNSKSMELPFGVIVNRWDLLYVHQHQLLNGWDLALRVRVIALGDMPLNFSPRGCIVRTVYGYFICLVMIGLLLLGMVNAVRLRLKLRPMTQPFMCVNVGSIWYTSKTWTSSTKKMHNV